MRFNWNKILLFFILILSIGILYASNIKNNSRTIDNINISIKPKSNYFISNDSIRSLINNEFNFNKDSIYLSRIEKIIDANTYIEKSEVYKTVGEQLEIIVIQKEPIARIISSDSIFYLDKNSNFMSLSELQSVKVPIIFGYNEFSDLKFLTNISLMIKEDIFLNKNISQILIDQEQRISLKLKGFKTIIEIGDNKNLKNKIQNLKAFYNRAFTKNEIDKYKKLNLQFENQVVAVK